ncbi:unnamed protein product [Linum trigynum]|uniref:Uncharacterized protein n=1 Tax=Linum trigynum TaxID=586398 RepID=A0AAV2EXH7_9ROSI
MVGESLIPPTLVMDAPVPASYSARSVESHSDEDTPIAEVREQSRRRRLILEADPDDDKLDLVEPKVQKAVLRDPPTVDLVGSKVNKPAWRPSRTRMAPPDDEADTTLAPTLKPRPIGRRKLRQNPTVQGGCSGSVCMANQDEEAVGAGSVTSSVPVIVEVTRLPISIEVAMEESQVELGLEDSHSEDEPQRFEIMKRLLIPKANTLRFTSKNRVSQVVAAFESGLTIDQKEEETSVKIVVESGDDITGRDQFEGVIEVVPQIDEYGSNIQNPDLGGAKTSAGRD